MSYTTSYIIDLANLELELDFLISEDNILINSETNEPYYATDNANRIMELESEIQQRTELF